MAVQGIVSKIYDSSQRTGIGSAWLADLAHLSPSPHHLLIRASVVADTLTNTVNTQALVGDLRQYSAAGFPVYLVLDHGFDVFDLLRPGATMDSAANAPLGFNGDRLLSRYINHFSLQAVAVVQHLQGLIAGVFIWNEPNLDSSTLAPGQIPTKPSSLAPEVFGALLYSTTKRLRAACPWLQVIYPGALSCLVGFDTDARGPWIGGYMDKAIAYLRAAGAVEPWEWDGVCLNLEGVVTESYMRYTAGAIDDLKGPTHWGVSGPLVVGEWGVSNGGPGVLSADKMHAAFTAINDHSDLMFFFSHHALEPGNPTSYGCTAYSQSNGIFIPTTLLPWHALVTDELARLYAS
jgi:hypothetical protein